jgi:Tfp pilus assembly protein PilZ
MTVRRAYKLANRVCLVINILDRNRNRYEVVVQGAWKRLQEAG